MALVQEKLNLAQRGSDKDKSRSGLTTPLSQKAPDDGVFSGFFRSKKPVAKSELRLDPVGYVSPYEDVVPFFLILSSI
jgi:hypothetical protein